MPQNAFWGTMLILEALGRAPRGSTPSQSGLRAGVAILEINLLANQCYRVHTNYTDCRQINDVVSISMISILQSLSMSKSGNKQFRKKGINFSTKVGTKFFSRTFFTIFVERKLFKGKNC